MSDIVRKRGDTYPMEFVVRADGVPLNVLGASFILTVDPNKDPETAATNLFSLVGVIVDAAGGVVRFTPTVSQVDRVGKFFYDIQMTDGTGAIRTVVAAKFELVQDITKV